MFKKIFKLILLVFIFLPLAACPQTGTGPSGGEWIEGVFEHEHDPKLPDLSTAVNLNENGLETDFDVTGKVIGLERKFNELIFIVRVRGKDIKIGSNMTELKYDIIN